MTYRASQRPRRRVLLADDHQLMLAGLKAVLAEDFDIVAAVTDGRQCIEETLRLRPDLVILDIGMPQLNGIEAARRIHAEIPSLPIIFITQQLDAHYVRAAFEAGGRAYVAKHSAATEIYEAVRAIDRGEFFITPVANLPDADTFPILSRQQSPTDFLGRKLTTRQREVLQLLAEGKSNKEIAAHLAISPKTVEFHRSAIMDTLSLRTTAELTRYALANGILSE